MQEAPIYKERIDQGDNVQPEKPESDKESDKELADKWTSLMIHRADHAEPFGGDD